MPVTVRRTLSSATDETAAGSIGVVTDAGIVQKELTNSYTLIGIATIYSSLAQITARRDPAAVPAGSCMPRRTSAPACTCSRSFATDAELRFREVWAGSRPIETSLQN